MANTGGYRVEANTPDQDGKHGNLMLGYGLVGLIALSLGVVGLLQQRRQDQPTAAPPPGPKVQVVVTGDDNEIIGKEERIVWGYNYLGLALFGPGVLALMMLFHIHNLLAVFIAGPLVVGTAMCVVLYTVRRWDDLVTRHMRRRL
jgi:hypothetical protein